MSWLFQLFHNPTHTTFLARPFADQFSDGPMLLVSNAVSDPLQPLFTGGSCGHCLSHRRRRDLFYQQPLAHGNAGYADSYWRTVCRYGDAQRDGKYMGIAIPLFLWACVID